MIHGLIFENPLQNLVFHYCGTKKKALRPKDLADKGGMKCFFPADWYKHPTPSSEMVTLNILFLILDAMRP